ncbi:hypothetical protein SAMN05444143_1084 [Flavobacterium succinicans]|uniref:DUF5723 domain-containing protein n=1 Tax=Flavobacterium succinicans TaxID=29536 RepID=A0A1I4X4L0_9FLAO|nr:DUF5723 family protein [Flavobacterium succinicans]SFN20433.1 hypothetical protein SAMN05444143_1084 [Flavobacterium succinicans]
MRKITLIVLLSVGNFFFAQNKAVLYNFTAIPQSLSLNPGADVSYKWYAGIPLLSGFSANVGSTGFSAYDLFADDGVDFNTKLRKVIFSTSRNDKVSVNQQAEVFQGGFKVGDWNNTAYISFGMYEELDVLSYVPKDFALLALDGNQNYLGKYFNLSDLNARAEMLTVFHVGYNKRQSEKLIWGVRGKIYSSIFDARSTKNSGYLYTIPSVDNASIYDQVISADMLLNTSGIAKYDDKDDDSDVAKDIKKRALLGGNLGLGFDVGITYYPKKDIQITASVLDVGFIRHSKEVESYRAKGIYNYEGILPDFFTGTGGNNVSQEFEDAFPRDTLKGSYTSWRPVKFNASAQYSFGQTEEKDCNCKSSDGAAKYNNSVGLQYFAMSTPRLPMMALTAFYRKKLFTGLEAKATYTVDSFSSKNIGLGLSTQIGPVNFYLMADNLLELRDVVKAQSASFQLGLNLIFAEKKDGE